MEKVPDNAKDRSKEMYRRGSGKKRKADRSAVHVFAVG